LDNRRPLNFGLELGSRIVGGGCDRVTNRTKKTGVFEHLEVFEHAGLLVNEPPDIAGLPFI